MPTKVRILLELGSSFGQIPFLSPPITPMGYQRELNSGSLDASLIVLTAEPQLFHLALVNCLDAVGQGGEKIHYTVAHAA